MLLKMVVKPVMHPVSLQEAKLHARVHHSREDALFSLCVGAATADCEKETRRQMVEATFELVLDSFTAGRITLPRPPVSTIESITYADANGADVLLDPAVYVLEGNEHTALAAPLAPWPSGSRVRIRFKGGWPVDTVTGVSGEEILKPTTPDALKQWILMRSTGLYEQRTDPAASNRKVSIPMSRDFMDGILDRYRLYGPEIEI